MATAWVLNDVEEFERPNYFKRRLPSKKIYQRSLITSKAFLRKLFRFQLLYFLGIVSASTLTFDFSRQHVKKSH